MYSISTVGVAAIAAFVLTSVSITTAPAQNTSSVSSIPPMYDIDWSSNQPLSPEVDYALHTFYVCEYSDSGHAALEEMVHILGAFTLTNDSERRDRAETMYSLAKRYEQEGVCRWSNQNQDYFLFGSVHSTEEYDLSEVPCTTLPNGICAYIQPMLNVAKEDATEIVYSLFTNDETIHQEIFGGEQWALIQ